MVRIVDTAATRSIDYASIISFITDQDCAVTSIKAYEDAAHTVPITSTPAFHTLTPTMTPDPTTGLIAMDFFLRQDPSDSADYNSVYLKIKTASSSDTAND